MGANDRRQWSCQVVLVAAVAVAVSSCGGPTTPPPLPTPTPAPTIERCTAGQPMTTFTVSPSTVTDGDTLTFSWTAPCGYVSIAQAGQSPFTTLQQSSGSYQLRPNTPGYPTAPGATVYEAKNGDTATPLRATVTVNTKNHPPTVTVAASPTGCHPQHWKPTSCSVMCTASASDQDGDSLSYGWSGCATGSASTATCTISEPGSFPCTVTVTDSKGGSVTGSATVQGTNEAPTQSNSCWHGGVDAGCVSATSFLANQACAGDALTYRFVAADPDDPEPWNSLSSTCTATSQTPGACTVCQCWLYNAGTMRFFVEFGTRAAGTCTLAVTVTDDWGAATTVTPSVTVK
jgi:hypothetical protein